MTDIFNATIVRVGLRVAAVVAIAGLLAAPGAQAQQPRGPLVLKSASYFYVGGKIDPRGKGSPIVGHMYVEYMIPQRLRSPYPIVMVHGGNQTGTNFTGTPDGREGWAQYFVRRGYAVYIVDQVAPASLRLHVVSHQREKSISCSATWRRASVSIGMTRGRPPLAPTRKSR